MANCPAQNLCPADPLQSRPPLRQAFGSTRCIHELSKIGRTVERCSTEDRSSATIITADAVLHPSSCWTLLCTRHVREIGVRVVGAPQEESSAVKGSLFPILGSRERPPISWRFYHCAQSTPVTHTIWSYVQVQRDSKWTAGHRVFHQTFSLARVRLYLGTADPFSTARLRGRTRRRAPRDARLWEG